MGDAPLGAAAGESHTLTCSERSADKIKNEFLSLLKNLPPGTSSKPDRPLRDTHGQYAIESLASDADMDRPFTPGEGRLILRLLPNPKLDLPPLQPDLPHWEDLGDITNTRQLFRNRHSQTLARLTTAHETMVSTWNDPLHIRLVAYMDAAADDGPAGPLCSAAVVVPELSTSSSRERPSRTTSREGNLKPSP
ncbi:hypothetical protein HPB47_022246 [Ixodes persulcatus]|uniref:Uncharacterized protein n=1 Tax=Ixodes persulcatus TaxID=34615 RepID=A0AC60QAM8_IXOPE|nr:hypothetical protein HPB47_022246 [Ixodes persulcatus]